MPQGGGLSSESRTRGEPSELGEEILADYLLGILPPEQARALEARLAQEPQLAAELQALQEALHLLPYGLPGMIPSASVRSQVMAEAGAPPIPPQPALPSLGLARLKVERRWLKGLGAVALLLLAFDNWRLRQTPQPAPLEAGQALAQLLQQPGSRLVTLQGEAGSANLLFRPGEWQAVVLAARALPPLPEGERYHLWLKLDTEEMLYGGSFQVDAQGSAIVALRLPQPPSEEARVQEVLVTAAPALPELGGKVLLSARVVED
jgi:hypothetical protein